MYTDILKKVMKKDNLKDLCVRIDLKDMVYPLSFIYCENYKYLVIDTTGEDGRERKVIIPKSKIISISVVYQQDIESIFGYDNKDEKMFN